MIYLQISQLERDIIADPLILTSGHVSTLLISVFSLQFRADTSLCFGHMNSTVNTISYLFISVDNLLYSGISLMLLLLCPCVTLVILFNSLTFYPNKPKLVGFHMYFVLLPVSGLKNTRTKLFHYQ